VNKKIILTFVFMSSIFTGAKAAQDFSAEIGYGLTFFESNFRARSICNLATGALGFLGVAMILNSDQSEDLQPNEPSSFEMSRDLINSAVSFAVVGTVQYGVYYAAKKSRQWFEIKCNLNTRQGYKDSRWFWGMAGAGTAVYNSPLKPAAIAAFKAAKNL
jgi:drug/metabolite transporter (DMT)-like permease